MSTALHTPLAVIGAACLLPGADGLDAYWSLLRDGREAIGEFPADRLDRSLYYCPEPGRRGRTYTGRAGLVPERQPDSGDQNWDLCHRLFCDVAREAVEHARLDPARLAALQAGVYVGHSAGSSANGDLTLATLAGHAFTPLLKMEGLDQASLFDKAVARLRQGRPRRHGPDQPAFETQRVSELVARALGLQGPQVVVDAACASGLVALALAGLDLASGSVEVALVGGASFAKVESLVLFSQAQSCSRSGQSRPFDESADGLVAAEGYVCLVVKTEARARHDGDRILGVVRGIGLSSDGRGRSLWAPQKEGQMAALRRAYADRLDPGRVQYLEAHATSTQVGDATELESLGEFFKPYTQAPIPLGSVKSNLGHTLETAGLAGLLKVLLALEQGQLPPSLGVEQLNRSVDWSSLPLEVVTSGLPWPRPEQGPRCAGVSAFGIGGLNVHVVVEEAGPRPLPGAPTPALEPVALVGRGVVLPGAHDLEGMRSGGHGPGPAPLERWPGHLGLANQNGHRVPSTPTVHGAFIRDYEYDYLAHKIPPKQVSRANPLQFQLLDATQQALAEAGAIEPGETAVVVGTTFGGDFNNELLLGLRFPEIQQCLRAILLEDGLAQTRVEAMLADFEREFFTLYPALLDETGGFTSSTLASRITKTFDLEGGAMAVEAGDCSSAVGLAAACALLRGGLCQAVICAGAARSLNLLTYETLNLRGFFAEPGYFPGEGVAVVVLMTLSEARRQGKRVLGLLHGTGSHFDPDQPGRALLAAGARALEGSRVKADRIRRLRLGQAPLELPGPELDHLYPQLEDQLKGLSGFGHLGAAEAVVNLVESSMSPHGFEAVGQTSPQGLATQILTSPAPPVTRPCSHLRLGGASLEEVMARLVDETDGGQQAFQAHHRVRLAILSPDPNRMADKRRLAASLIGDPQARPRLEEQGIFLGTLTAPLARVAFVFAGQGSQYPGMMRDVVEASPAAAALLTRADSALHSHGLGSFASLAWEDDEALDADPVTTQVAVLVANCLIYEAIREAGLEPDCVAGHSFGEIPAMVAARVITLEEAIALTIERARALRQASPDGGLISIQATPQQLLPLLEQAPGELFITHRNAPSQTVVGGKLEHLERLAASLKDKSLAYRRLPVPGALHTPLVASAQPALARVLEGLQLRPPTRLFYSNVTNDRVHDPSGFAQNLVAQLVEPVVYAELLERMRADGVGVFLEVGPGQILTGLHRQVLAQDQVVLTAADHRRRSYGEQLERVKAALECVGLSSWSTSPNLPRPVGGPIEEFDATAARRSRQHPTPLAADTGESRSELARYLIDFVVEYTGYPAEVIDLDWDLEADLGIDSIRRTQLLGEIGEVFSIQTKGKVDLDSFKTLRQLLAFLQQDTPDQTKSGVDPAYQQAVERGRQIAQPLRQLLRQAALLEDDLEEPGAQPSPSQRLELEGIAHGAGVHPSNLLGYCLRGGQLPQAGVPATAHTHRYVVGTNLLPLPPEGPTRPRLHGGALVVGAGPVARALAAQLSDLTQPVELRAELSPQELERLWPENAFPHLFLVPEDGEDDWQQRRQRVLWGPFALCQAWLRLVKASGLMEEASLVGITSLGGSFGLEAPPVRFDSAALPGLFKAIVIEQWVAGFRHLPVKVLDSSGLLSPGQTATAALQELANPSYEVEVGLSPGGRCLVRAEKVSLELGSKPLRGRWVCTGGARGITAYVVSELGRRYQLEFHLLGRVKRTALPPEWTALWPDRRSQLKVLVMEDARRRQANPVGAWEQTQKLLELEASLAHFEQLGVKAHYHACDVADRQALAEVLEHIRKEGPIQAVLHGAGASRDSKFEHKDPERVEQCFRAKLDGTLALMELTRQDALDFFVAFGSISGRFGANGHADYSMANDMMAKLVSWYWGQRPEVSSTTFHWHAWGDVGMATRAETQLGLQMVDLAFMPAHEGVEHLLRELTNGCPDPEVLITDEHYYRRFYYQEPAQPQTCPMLIGGQPSPDGFSLTLDPEQEIFLKEHRLDDTALLPMVVALELLVEAALPDSQGGCELHRVEALGGLKFHRDQPRRLQLKTDPQPSAGLRTELIAEVRAGDGTLLEAERVFFRAEVTPLTGGARPEPVAPPEGSWQPVHYHDRGARLFHGPALRALRRVQQTSTRLWGRLVSPAAVELGGTRRPTVGWRVPCAALDACLYAVGTLAWGQQPRQTVPKSIGRLRIFDQPRPREECTVEVLFLRRQEESGFFEFRLFGQQGQPLLEALDYQLQWLGSPALVTRD